MKATIPNIIDPIIIHITTFKNLLVGYFTLPIIIKTIPTNGQKPDNDINASLESAGSK